MSRQESTKARFNTPLISQVIYEESFSGPGHFSLSCCVSILETLIKFSIQRDLRVYFSIKKAFESLKQIINFYANYYQLQQEVVDFFGIIDHLSNNNIIIPQRFQALHYMAKSNDENHKNALEKGMKLLTAVLFDKERDILNVIMQDNEVKVVGRIFAMLSDHFKIKFIVVERDRKNEYPSVVENFPLIFMKCDYGKSSVLYTKDMIEIENLPNFSPERLEEFPFMSKALNNQSLNPQRGYDLVPPNFNDLPNARPTPNSIKLNIPDDLIEFISIMAEVLVGNSIFNDKIAYEALKITGSYEKFKNIRALSELAKTNPNIGAAQYKDPASMNNISNPPPSMPPIFPAGQKSQPKNSLLTSGPNFGSISDRRFENHPIKNENGNPSLTARRISTNESGIIYCEYRNHQVQKEYISDIKCHDKCIICNDCRLCNLDQCAKCGTIYTDSTKELLRTIKYSIISHPI